MQSDLGDPSSFADEQCRWVTGKLTREHTDPSRPPVNWNYGQITFKEIYEEDVEYCIRTLRGAVKHGATDGWGTWWRNERMVKFLQYTSMRAEELTV